MTEATRSFPRNTRMGGQVELICACGHGHPSRLLTEANTWSRLPSTIMPAGLVHTHPCCGCCESEEFKVAERDHLRSLQAAQERIQGTTQSMASSEEGLEGLAAGRGGAVTRHLARAILGLLDRVSDLEEAAKEAGWKDYGWLPPET